jgi:hypothetical protein
MRSGGELRERLDRAATAIVVPGEDLEGAARAGRRRRTRSRVAVATAALMVGGLLLGSIAVLAPTDRSRTFTVFAADEGPRRTTVTQFGVGVTYPSDWTLLVRPESADAPPPPPVSVYQLSNWDPGVVGPDAAGAWLCPLDPRRVPSDGVVLVVSGLGEAAGGQPWPVPLPSATSIGPCGEGSYAEWSSAGLGFTAYVVVGAEASAADLRRLDEAFASMTFRPDVFLPEVGEGNPQAVIASGEAFGSPWNLLAYTGETGANEGLGCIGLYSDFGGGAGCYVRRDGTLDVIDPLFGNDRFVWSSGSSCGSGHDGEISIDGMVADEVAAVHLELLDGRTIELQLVSLPNSWDVPYRAFVGAVADVPEGPPYEHAGSPDWPTAGEFVLLDVLGTELSRVPFAVGVGC